MSLIDEDNLSEETRTKIGEAFYHMIKDSWKGSAEGFGYFMCQAIKIGMIEQPDLRREIEKIDQMLTEAKVIIENDGS